MAAQQILSLAQRNLWNDLREPGFEQFPRVLRRMIQEYALDMCDYLEDAILHTARDISHDDLEELNELARELVRSPDPDMARFFHRLYTSSYDAGSLGLRWYLRNDYLLVNARHCNRAQCRGHKKCTCSQPLVRENYDPMDLPAPRETLLDVANN